MEDPEIEPLNSPETEVSPETQDTPEPEPEPGPETAHALPQTISIEEWMASNDADAEEAPAQSALEDVQLLAVLEACVYVAEEPLMPVQIAAALNQDPERVKALLQRLIAEYDRPEHGVSIKEIAGGYKMATKAEHHEAVRNFVKSLKAPLKLSLPALETLAVVAYKQPVTSPEIMEIRGVQGGGVLKTLLDRRLITESGRKNVIGKPILYKTTKEFLIQFGLKDLSELPTLKEFEEIRRMAMADSDVPAEAPAAESGALKAAPQAVAAKAPPAEGTAAETEAGAEGPQTAIEAATEAAPIAPTATPEAAAEAPEVQAVPEETPEAIEGTSAEETEAEATPEPAAADAESHAVPAETPAATEGTAAAETEAEAAGPQTPGPAPADAESHAVSEETPAATGRTEAAAPEAEVTTSDAHASTEVVIEETPAAPPSTPERAAGTPAPKTEAPAGEPAPPESQDH